MGFLVEGDFSGLCCYFR